MTSVTSVTGESGGVDAWADLLSRSFIPLHVGGSVGPDFRGMLSQVNLGDVVLTEVTADPSAVQRTPRLITASDADFYLLSLHLAGRGVVEQDNRQARLSPGDAVLYDSTRPYRLLLPTATRQLVLHLPRRELRRRLPLDDDSVARALSADALGTRVLRAFARELVGTIDAVPPGTAAQLGHTAVELLATCLAPLVGADRPDPGRAADLRRMQTFVLTNLADPNLTPATIAAAFGVSRRHVTTVFAASGTSPARYVREQRLAACRRDLADPRQRHRTIADIARAHGFTDPAVFARTFRRQYGATARDYRHMAGTARLT